MKNTLVIVPARGTSKGVSYKNLQTIFGASLKNLAIIVAKRIVLRNETAIIFLFNVFFPVFMILGYLYFTGLWRDIRAIVEC